MFIGVSIASLLSAARPEVSAVIFVGLAVPLFAVCAARSRLRLGTLLVVIYALFVPLVVGYVLNPISPDILPKFAIVLGIVATGWVSCVAGLSPQVRVSFVLAGLGSLLTSGFLLWREGLESFIEEGARLTGGENSHPNLIGLAMVCVALAGAAARHFVFRYGLILASFSLDLIVQSRNALLGSAVVLVMTVVRDIARRWGWPGVALLGICLSLAGLLAAGTFMESLSTILMLDDPYRGTGSGFVGRSELWAAAWHLFLDYPLFGFGMGQHTIGAHLDMYAHNMYLIVLSESGIVGFAAYLLLTLLALRGLALARRNNVPMPAELAFAMCATIVVYYAYGIFEGRAINAGNLLSFLFFFSIGSGLAAFVVPREAGAKGVKPRLAARRGPRLGLQTVRRA